MSIEKVEHPLSAYQTGEEFIGMLNEEIGILRKHRSSGVEDEWYYQGFVAASRMAKKFIELRLESPDED